MRKPVHGKKKTGLLFFVNRYYDLKLVHRVLMLLLLFVGGAGEAVSQAPNIGYSTPPLYTSGSAITSLSPTNSGGSIPAKTFREVSRFAGSGTQGGTDNANPLQASFNDTRSLVMDALGNIYVAEYIEGRIRKIATNGTVSTIMDLTGSYYPSGLAINSSTGDLYLAIDQHAVYRFPNTNSANYPSQAPTYTTPTNVNIATFLLAGVYNSSGTTEGAVGTGKLKNPRGLAIDATNANLYVADYGNGRIRKIVLSNGVLSTHNSTIASPEDLVLDASGNVYVTSTSTRRVHKIASDLTVTTIAGNTSSTGGFVDGIGTVARFHEPRGIDLDAAGNLYVADGGNSAGSTGSYAVRKITPTGIVTTLAGSGTGDGNASTDGVGTAARFDLPWDVIVDRSGHALYVADDEGLRIRKIELGGYTVWPSLPEGLSFSATTGVISGTPTVRSRQVYYADDFDDASGGTNTSIAGDAAYTSGWVRLTENSITQNGGFQVDASGVNSSALQVDFTLITSKTTNADAGLSYSFSDDGTINSGSEVQLGVGTGFSLSFQTNNGNTQSVRLYYGAKSNPGSVTVGSNGLLAVNTSQNALWLGKTSNVSLIIDVAGRVTVSINGTSVFSNVQLPAAYLSANKSTWKHIFRGAAGFFNYDLHAIDDLVIRQESGAANHTVTGYNASGSSTALVNVQVVDLPSLTTTAASSVTASGAGSGGNITDDGGSSVTARGVVWSTAPSPTVALSTKTTNGTGTGSFTSSIIGLAFETTYYLRAYATTAGGTAYGAELSFTTLSTAPSISYPSASYSFATGIAITPLSLANTGGTPDKVQVSTLAGNGTSGAADGISSAATFRSLQYLTLDGNEILYVADRTNNRIRKIIIGTGVVSTLAPTVSLPSGVVADGSGNLYVSLGSHRIQKLTIPSGTVSNVAGLNFGFADGVGTVAQFWGPEGLALDGSGNLYVADLRNNSVRKIILSTNEVSTFAGTNTSGFLDDVGSAARFAGVGGVVADGNGNLYVADIGNDCIRRIEIASKRVSTVAGSIPSGLADGIGAAAKFNDPMGMALDGSGNLYVADQRNHRIRKIVITTREVSTVAGNGTSGSFADGLGTAAAFNNPTGIAADVSGNLYVADRTNNRIRIISNYRIDPALPAGLFFDARTGTISGTPTQAMAARQYTVYTQNAEGSTTTQITISVASAPTVATGGASSVTASSATLAGTVNANGNATSSVTILYSTVKADVDGGNGTSAVVNPTTASGSTVTAISADISGLTPSTTYYYRISATNSAGTSNGNTLSFTTGPAAPVLTYGTPASRFSVGTAITPLTITNTGGAVEPVQVGTLAGGTTGYSASGYVDAAGSAAKFNMPNGVAVDGNGTVYVADYLNHVIRKITQGGMVSTLAGSGESGYADATAAMAKFSGPLDVALDGLGNLYVADAGNYRIRKVVIATAEVTTVAGSGKYGFANGFGTGASFRNISGIALDGTGNLYVADGADYRIRKINLSNNEVTTLAGSGSAGSLNAIGELASFALPAKLTADGNGNLYVVDGGNNRIRKIVIATQEVTTFAGNIGGYADGTGTAAMFQEPTGITKDPNGNLYITEATNQVIRKITPSGAVTTLAGTSESPGYADGAGSKARFYAPAGIAADADGNLYVADMYNHNIRKVSNYAISPALPASLSFNSATGAITGTPTVLSPPTTYTITGGNTGGTATTTLTLEVSSSLLTTDVTAITETTASSGGTVDASTFSAVTSRGVVWSTSVNPDITLSTKTSDGTGAGTFTSALTGLTPNTTYYVRSYVIHSGGTDYGVQKTFKTNQLGTFPDIPKTFGDANFSLTAPTAVSPGAFSYASSDPAVATISGSTVTITGAGTATITATQAAAGAYASISKTLTLTVNKATPIITLNIPSTVKLNTVTGANTITVSGTSSDGQTVALSIVSGGASGTLTATGTPGEYTLSNVSSTGIITFQGYVAGNSNYNAASKQAALDVQKSNQTITFNALSPVTYVNGLTQSLTATSNSGLPVTFTPVSGPGSIAGSTLTITGTGSIVIKASQAGDLTHNPAPDMERTLVVNPGAPIVSSFTPASATEGDVVTITGQYFENVSAVSFGGTAATSFTVVSSTSITAVVGTGASGSVSVTTTGGTHSRGGFRYKVLWTGATNAFNRAANWSGNRVPQTDDDIVFASNAASDLELDGSKTVGNVDFNGSGRSLKLGAHNLIVKGNVTMPGNITGSGKVIMRGSGAQTITGGGSIPDLEIDNTSGVSIDASGAELRVTGVLRSTAGALTTNGKLRLTSSSGGTARVGVVGGSITGNVIAERFVQRNNNADGTGRAWRLVSIPVSGSGTLRDFFMNGRNGQDLTDATVVSGEDMNAGTPIVGHGYASAAAATAAGFDWIGVANMVSSLRYYSGDAGGGTFNSDQVPSLSTTYSAADQGYMVFTRGDRKLNFPDANSASSTTFRSTGTLKTGNQQVSVAPASTSKYTLVGNPYMSVLDLNAFYTTNSAVINPSFWIWEPNIAGTYKQGEYINVYKSGTEWVTNTGTYINPQLIESGVAFFVEPVSSLATATNITIMETHKSSETSAGLAPLSTEPKDERGRLFVKLQRADARGERQLIDGVALEFHKDLKETLGDAIDHEKLRNGISRGSLWVTNSGRSLSSEGRPWPALDSRRSIPLQMSNIGDQTLIVSIDPRGMNKPGLKAWLKDNSLNTQQEIDLSKVNEFDFIGTGSAAKDSTRFEIVYAQQPLPPVKFINTSAKKVVSGVETKWETPLDAGASYEIVRSADLESFTTIHKQHAAGKVNNSYRFTDTKPHPLVNYYRVVSKNATGQLWMSNWMRVNMSMRAGDWKLYPNPSAETKLQLELAEVKAGTYTVSVFDQQGRQVDQQRIEHGGGNRVHGLILPKRLTTGIYILQVTNTRGEIEQTMKWMRE